MGTEADTLHRLASLAEVSSSSEQEIAWRRVIAHVRDHPSLVSEPGTAYTAGYAYYQLVESLPEAASQSAELLRSAALERPDDPYAKLYLGHLAFDAGKYVEALEWFDALPARSFAASRQEWRDLKRQELRICCLIRLCALDGLVREFERYVELAGACEPIDAKTVSELPKLVAMLAGAARHVV